MTETKTFVLAGGCYWCLDAAYRVLQGVTSVESVFTGGETSNPTYDEVCTGRTGHAEAVVVTFNPEVIPETVILDAFFTMHDPTQLNRQGNDIGTQYRSAMFYSDDSQRHLFEEAKMRAEEWWESEIVTSIEPLGEIFAGPEEHQDFFANNPDQAYCLAVAVPKVSKVRRAFAQYLKP